MKVEITGPGGYSTTDIITSGASNFTLFPTFPRPGDYTITATADYDTATPKQTIKPITVSTTESTDADGNTASPYWEVVKNFGLGVAASVLADGCDSINMIQSVLLSIFGEDAISYYYTLVQGLEEDNLAFLESKVTDETAYYAGRFITDLILVGLGIFGAVEGIAAIIAGLTGDAVSVLGEGLSLGSGTPLFALTAAVSTAAVAIGTLEAGAGIALAASAGFNGFNNFNELVRSLRKTSETPVLEAGAPSSPEWRKAVKFIKEGKGKSINVKARNQVEAEQLINEARPDLPKMDAYPDPKSLADYEIHPIDNDANMPHIKWRDWRSTTTSKGEGHIFWEE